MHHKRFRVLDLGLWLGLACALAGAQMPLAPLAAMARPAALVAPDDPALAAARLAPPPLTQPGLVNADGLNEGRPHHVFQ